MKRTIDFHIHTNCSDGALSPCEVVELAKANGVIAMSIADHDTIDAYNQTLFECAQKSNVVLIPAVEISTTYFGVGFHVLGYGIDLKNENLRATLAMLKNARRDYLFNVAKALNNLGYYVDIEKLAKLPSVAKSHIALDAVEQECNREALLKQFGNIPNKGTFIETLMNEGCPAFVEKYRISPIEASKIIHNAGGKVVLAHPVAYIYEDGLSESQIKDLIVKMDADGVESYYIYTDKDDNIIDECNKWGMIANELGKFKTIGSDFHVSDEHRPEIGFVNTTLELNEEQIQEIINNLKN
ncbi:MAG: PHP domain-containing protein [Clostridia bacterium]|nr:PHP domain-containing protein [Clostridia bacterium]